MKLCSGIALVGALALVAPSGVAAQDGPPPAVAYRQAMMQAIRSNLAQLRAATAVNHPDHVVQYTRALYGLGEMLGEVFPAGTAEGSRALPAIWQNRADFDAKVKAFQDATAQLLEAGERRDAAAVTAAAQAVQGTCGGCHTPYRGPAN